MKTNNRHTGIAGYQSGRRGNGAHGRRMRGNDHQEYDRDRHRSAGLGHRRAAVSPLAAVVSVAVSALLAAALLAASADPGAPDSTAPIASAARFAVAQPASLVSAHFFVPASVLVSVLPVAAWPIAAPAFAGFSVFQPASALAVEVFPSLVPAADTLRPRV